MSHSQFHSTKLFILRHAWLNLWDKHMTTGRINQVTTIHLLWLHRSITTATNGTKTIFTDGSSSKLVEELIAAQLAFGTEPTNKRSQQLKHLVPRSHKFQAQFSLLQKSNKDHGLWRELLTTGQQKKLTAVVVDSQVVNCNRFSY